MKLPPYIDPSASYRVQAPTSLEEGIVEGDQDGRDGERKRIALEAVNAEHKEAEDDSE